MQRHETNESSIKIKMKSSLGNKLKIVLKERQEKSTKANESRISSENIAKK